MITLGAFILSGLRIHEGAESFTPPEGLSYHLPMQLLFLSLLALFVIVQLRSSEPYVDFRYFRQKYFSMAPFSNTTYHLSMLAVTTLIPIVVENGLGQAPIVVTKALLPGRVLGLFLPVLAGWLYDHYNPRWLRPGSMMLIAVGFLLVGFFSADVPIWGLPLLMAPLFLVVPAAFACHHIRFRFPDTNSEGFAAAGISHQVESLKSLLGLGGWAH